MIFNDWIITLDHQIRFKNPNRKILLLLDNATSHCINDLNLSNIEVLFLPAGTTSKIQPLDAGIIASFKSKYKQKFVKWLLKNYQEGSNNNKILSLIDAIKFISLSWYDVTQETVFNCWKHSGLINDCNVLNANYKKNAEVELQAVLNDVDNMEYLMNAHEYLNIDDFLGYEDETMNLICNDKIINKSESSVLGIDYDKNCSNSDLEERFVDFKTALEACQTLQTFLLQQNDNFKSEIHSLCMVDDFIQYKINTNKKQTTLDKFMKKT